MDRALATPTIETARPVLPARQLIVLLLLAAVAHAFYWTTRPPDMALFLEQWFAHIVHHGPVGAFAYPFSNYEPAYLYLLALGSLAHDWLAPMDIIKLLSVAGSLFLTLSLARLIKAFDAPPRLALFLLVLPSVVINAALLGQCDALWAGCCLFALGAMVRGRDVRALVWCGLAIAFKSQAAFIAPVMVGALIGRRAPWWQWAIPPLVFLATLVPAWAMGWPLVKLLTVYPGQAALVLFPGRLGNPWLAATLFFSEASRPYYLIGYAAALAAGAMIALLAARHSRDRRILLLLALLSATALPFLLPKMLERYYFLADVLAVAVALAWRTRKSGLAALAIQSASLVTLLTYIYSYHWPYPALLGIGFAAAGLATTISLLRDCAISWPDAAALLPRLASAERTIA